MEDPFRSSALGASPVRTAFVDIQATPSPSARQAERHWNNNPTGHTSVVEIGGHDEVDDEEGPTNGGNHQKSPSPAGAGSGNSELLGTRRWVDGVMSSSPFAGLRHRHSNSAASSSSLPKRASAESSVSAFCQSRSCNRMQLNASHRNVQLYRSASRVQGSSSGSEDDDDAAQRGTDIQTTSVTSTADEGEESQNDSDTEASEPSRAQRDAPPPLYDTRILLSLYKLLDLDNDDVVSVSDLYAFIALHPQAVDLAVANVARATTRSEFRHAARPSGKVDGSVAVVVPYGRDLKVLSSSHCSTHSSAMTSSRASSVISDLPKPREPKQLPTLKQVEGSLWWIHERMKERTTADRFVAFVMSLAQGPTRSGSEPNATVSFHTFQLVYHEIMRLLYAVGDASCPSFAPFAAVLDLDMLRQVDWFYEYCYLVALHSGRLWMFDECAPFVSSSAHEGGLGGEEGASSSSSCDAGNQGRLGRERTTSRKLRFSSVASGHSDDRQNPMDFNAALTEEQAAAAKFKFDEVLNTALETATAACTSASPEANAVQIATPLPTALPAVYWTFAGWDMTAVVEVHGASILQRLGEMYLKHKARKHVSHMRQFLRHLLTARSTQCASSVRTLPLPLASFTDQYQHHSRSVQDAHRAPNRNNNSARTERRSAPMAIAESIALLKLVNRFLAFKELPSPCSASSSSSSTTLRHGHSATATNWSHPFPGHRAANAIDRTVPAVVEPHDLRRGQRRKSIVDHVLENGMKSLWEVDSNASTQASPHQIATTGLKPKQRLGGLVRFAENSEANREAPIGDHMSAVSVSEQCTTVAAAAPPLNMVAVSGPSHSSAVLPPFGSAAAAPSVSEMTTESAIRQSLLLQDQVLHSMTKPEPLSMVTSLNGPERQWMKDSLFWCMFRAAWYAVLAAVLIGGADLLAQAYFLGASSTSSLFGGFASMPSDIQNWFVPQTYSNLWSALLNTTTTVTVVSNATNGSGETVTQTSLTTDFQAYLKYQLVVVAVTLVISAAEIVFLYLDNLQVCLGFARNAGIPLDSLRRMRRGSTKQMADDFASEWTLDQATAAAGSFEGVAQGHGNRSDGSGSTLDGRAAELRVIRQHVSEKRTESLIAAITRCALQIDFDTVSIFHVDVRDRTITRFRRWATSAFMRLRRIAPSVVLRLVASRILSRFLAPFLAIPLLVFWNCMLARKSVEDTKLVVLAAVTVESAVTELLGACFMAPHRWLSHNSETIRPVKAKALSSTGWGGESSKKGDGALALNLGVLTDVCSPLSGRRSQRGDTASVLASGRWPNDLKSNGHLAHNPLSPSGVGVHMYLTRALFSVPFHIMREALALCVFYAHVVYSGKCIHPALHHIMVHMMTSCEVPDVAVWLTPRSKPASSKTPDDGGSRFSLPAVLDVGGGKYSVLGMWLRLFVKELNAIRAVVWSAAETGRQSEWLQMHIDNCPWMEEAAQRRSQLQSCASALRQREAMEKGRLTFLLENMFPGWASSHCVAFPSTYRRLGNQAPLVKPHFGTTEPIGDDWDESTSASSAGGESPQSTPDGSWWHRAQLPPAPLHASRGFKDQGANSRGTWAPSASFQVQDVKFFLCLAIITTLTTTRWHRGGEIKNCVRRRTFLLHLLGAYLGAKYHSTTGVSQRFAHGRMAPVTDIHPRRMESWTEGQKFLERIEALHRLYWSGSPAVTIPTVMAIIDESTT